ACPRTKAIWWSRQVSASQYQGWTRSQATSRPSRKGATARRKGSGWAGRLRPKRVRPSRARTTRYKDLACGSTPAENRGSAGGWKERRKASGSGWCDGRRLGALSIIAYESLHEHPGAAPDLGRHAGFARRQSLAAAPAGERRRSAVSMTQEAAMLAETLESC